MDRSSTMTDGPSAWHASFAAEGSLAAALRQRAPTWVSRARCAVALALLMLLAFGACNRHERREHAPSASASAQRPKPAPAETELIVFAAASLKESFAALDKDFEKTAQRVKVVYNFAGSQELRTQIEQGAAADVFASADVKHMKALVDAQRASGPQLFATNEPVVVVSKESISAIKAFADLPNAKHIVLGAAEVPIGHYSLQILERASTSLGADFRSRVEAKVVSHELNVKQVLVKVRMGEADAGIVYRTDTKAAVDAGEVGLVAIPPDVNVVAEYPIAVLVGAPHPKLAAAWVRLVLSEGGQKLLRDAGFLAVPGVKP